MAKKNNEIATCNDVLLITKTDLSNHFSDFNEINKEFYTNIKSIYDSLPDSQRYVYHISLPYGRQLINKALFVALSSQSNEKIQIVDAFSDKILRQNDLINDFGENIDFPLSIVIKNYVEIYYERKLEIGKSGVLKFPLDHIKQGELFGVWGSLNLVRENDVKSIIPKNGKSQNWHGVAGRECFVTFFNEYPSSATKLSNKDKVFQALFDTNEPLKPEKALQKFIRENVENSSVEILCFPKHYFLQSKEQTRDAKSISVAQKSLITYLLKKEWNENNSERHIFWNNINIKDNLLGKNIENLDYIDIQVTNHVINIIEGNDFYLKNISKNDTIEFNAFELMVKKINSFDFKNGKSNILGISESKVICKYSSSKDVVNLFELFTPYFMYFSRDWDCQSMGFTFLKSPPIMDLFFYNKSKENTKKDIEKFDKLNEHINEHLNKNIPTNQNKHITYELLIETKQIEKFINNRIGNNLLDNDSARPFEIIKEVIEKPAKIREFFSSNKDNIPEIFKQYAFFIYYK